jgi:hypothetical protein
MKRNISYDICWAIRPLLYVSRALGLAPYAYVKKKLPGGKMLEKPEISSAALIYSMFFLALHLCVLAVSFVFKSRYIYSQMPATDSVPDILIHTVSKFSIVSIVLSVTKNRNAIVKIIFLNAETERVILTSSMEYYRKAKVTLFVQVLVIFTVLGLFSVYDYVTWYSIHGVMFLSSSHMYVDTIIEWIVVIQFVNMVVLLKDRFSHLNTCLFNLSGIFEFENSKEKFYLPSLESARVSVKEMKWQVTKKKILTFNNIHDTLIDTALLVNSTYEVQICLSLLSDFVGITIWTYFGLCFLYGYYSAENAVVSKTRVIVLLIIRSLLHISKLVCLTVPCHSANNNMAHTFTVFLAKYCLHFILIRQLCQNWNASHITSVYGSSNSRFSDSSVSICLCWSP